VKTWKKIADIAGLASDLAPGLLTLALGLGVIVGGTTGVLWY
jgi:hypothetical protein